MGEKFFQILQRAKEDKQVSTAFLDNMSPVDRAAAWSHELVMREARGPGDLDNAMKRVGRRIGVGYQAIRSLRYRRPKDVPASVFFKIGRAYHELLEHQFRKTAHELDATKAFSGASHASVAATEIVVDAFHDAFEAPLEADAHRQA